MQFFFFFRKQLIRNRRCDLMLRCFQWTKRSVFPQCKTSVISWLCSLSKSKSRLFSVVAILRSWSKIMLQKLHHWKGQISYRPQPRLTRNIKPQRTGSLSFFAGCWEWGRPRINRGINRKKKREWIHKEEMTTIHQNLTISMQVRAFHWLKSKRYG